MLSNKRCIDCYYYDVCPKYEACDDFTPITDEGEDAVIEEIIEQGREEYRAAWNEYISEYHD